jgi:hypothetical protein
MKPIQLPKQTIEAILNGAEYILLPIKGELFHEALKNTYLQQGRTDEVKLIVKNHNTFVDMCRQIQPNESYYIQEEFLDIIKGVTTAIIYKQEHEQSTDEKEIRFDESSKMTPEQSRIHFACESVEIKRLQELKNKELLNLGFSEYKTYEDFRYEFSPTYSSLFVKGIEVFLNTFKHWFNSQHKQQYEDNPYCILAKIKR